MAQNGESKIDALAADQLIKGSWFEGYAKQVSTFDAMVTLEQFDGNSRGDLNRGPEYIIFKTGLQVKDFVRLGDYHSIYVILGDLEAESVETGDAILIVTGKIKAGSYLLNFQNEGIILDGRATYDDQDETSSLPRSIEAPLMFWYNRQQRKIYLYKNGEQVADNIDDMKTHILDEFFEMDMDEFILKENKVVEALRKKDNIVKQ
jgi:hypothetical protein